MISLDDTVDAVTLQSVFYWLTLHDCCQTIVMFGVLVNFGHVTSCSRVKAIAKLYTTAQNYSVKIICN